MSSWSFFSKPAKYFSVEGANKFVSSTTKSSDEGSSEAIAFALDSTCTSECSAKWMLCATLTPHCRGAIISLAANPATTQDRLLGRACLPISGPAYADTASPTKRLTTNQHHIAEMDYFIPKTSRSDVGK